MEIWATNTSFPPVLCLLLRKTIAYISHLADFRSKLTLECRYTVIIITVCVNIERWRPFFIPILCVSLFSLFLLQNIHFTTWAIVWIDCRCCYALHHKLYQNLQGNINKGSIISSFAVHKWHKIQQSLKGGPNKWVNLWGEGNTLYVLVHVTSETMVNKPSKLTAARRHKHNKATFLQIAQREISGSRNSTYC